MAFADRAAARTDGASGDADLVAASRAGDREAFAKLVDRYRGLVFSLAYSETGSFALGEDIAQETFVGAWVNLGRLRDPSRFRSYICSAARRLSHRQNRREARLVHTDSEVVTPYRSDAESNEPSPLDRMITREEETLLWRVLGRLPATYRLPLVLYYHDGQSIDNVARALELSHDNVEQRLSRGRKMLQGKFLAILQSALTRISSQQQFTAGVIAAIALAADRRAEAAPRGRSGLAKLMAVAVPLALGSVGSYLWVVGRTGDPRRAIVSGSQPVAPGTWARSATAAVPGESPPAAESRTGEATTGAGRFVTFAFDFEDGVLPPLFELGHVIPCTHGAPSRFCITGTMAMSWPQTYQVKLTHDGEPVFFYSHDALLAFDFWVGDDYAGDNRPYIAVYTPNQPPDPQYAAGPFPWAVSVSLRHSRQAQNHHFYVRRYRPEAWNHAEIPLSAFLANDRSRRFEAGDPIESLGFGGGKAGGKPFLVDNIRIEIDPEAIRRVPAQFLIDGAPETPQKRFYY